MMKNIIEDVSPHVNNGISSKNRASSDEALDLSAYEIDGETKADLLLLFEGVELNDTDSSLIDSLSLTGFSPGKPLVLLVAYLKTRGASAAVSKRTLMRVLSLSQDGAGGAIKSFSLMPHAEVEKGGGPKPSVYGFKPSALWQKCLTELPLGKFTSMTKVVSDATELVSSSLDPLRTGEQFTKRTGEQFTSDPALIENARALLTAAAAASQDLSAPNEASDGKRASPPDYNPDEPLIVDISLNSNYRARLIACAGEALMDEIRAPQIASMMIPQMWLNEGASFEEDILTTVRRMTVDRRPRSIRTWAFFSEAVADARATREAATGKAREAMASGKVKNGVDTSNRRGYTEPTKEDNDEFWNKLSAKIKEKENAKSNGSLPEALKAIF